jgi:hypothetical protein
VIEAAHAVNKETRGAGKRLWQLFRRQGSFRGVGLAASIAMIAPAMPLVRVEQATTRLTSIREALDRERREEGGNATRSAPAEPEDAIATARFIGALRQHTEQAGLSLGDVAHRSGIDVVVKPYR